MRSGGGTVNRGGGVSGGAVVRGGSYGRVGSGNTSRGNTVVRGGTGYYSRGYYGRGYYGRGYYGRGYSYYYPSFYFGLGYGGYPYYDPYYYGSYYSAPYYQPYYEQPYYDQAPYDGTVGYAQPAQPPTVINQSIGTPAPSSSYYRAADYYLIAFNDHVIQAALSFRVEGDQIFYTTREHEEKSAPLASVDRMFSEQINRDRRVEFRLP
jgi:hypothetical protein